MSPDTFNIGSMYFGDQAKSIHSKNTNRIVQINIKSIRNIFDELVLDGRGNIDILMISEFLVDDYISPYRLGRNGKGGGKVAQ